MDKEKRLELLNLAIKARKNAYIPYSHFGVGAAALFESGKIYTGCNIENIAFGSTICAERTAIVKAASEGERKLVAIAVVGGPENGELLPVCEPCGACRQVMSEFADGDMEIIFGSSEDDMTVYTLNDILPMRVGFTL